MAVTVGSRYGGAADAALTCAGGAGRTIDFLLVSRKLLPMLEAPRQRLDTLEAAHRLVLSCLSATGKHFGLATITTTSSDSI